MLGVLLSLLKIFNGNFITTTRLLFAMGRRDLLEERLGRVDGRFRTPTVAVIFVGSITALASFLGQAVLVPISEVGSMASATGWLATCLAFLFGAAKGGSRHGRAIAYGGAIVAALLIVMKLAPFVPGSFGVQEYIALGVWAAAGFFLWTRRTRTPVPS